MKALIHAGACLGLMLCAGCGTSTDPKKLTGDVLTKQKDELLSKLEKMLPEADKHADGLKKKIAGAEGESKTALEKLLTKLKDLRKSVADKIEELKKSGIEGLKDKMAALTGESESLGKVMKEAAEALKKKEE
jgi:hypothetical protein